MERQFLIEAAHQSTVDAAGKLKRLADQERLRAEAFGRVLSRIVQIQFSDAALPEVKSIQELAARTLSDHEKYQIG